MASGATVKPSLMFFKKFTAEEVTQYEQAKDKAYKQVLSQYTEQIGKHILRIRRILALRLKQRKRNSKPSKHRLQKRLSL